MCAAFIEAARSDGWIVYPETSGFDILLVASEQTPGDFEPGDIVGVEAKLRPSIKLLTQALPPEPVPGDVPDKMLSKMGAPDFFTVLVPGRGASRQELRTVCDRLGIGLLLAPTPDSRLSVPWGLAMAALRAAPRYDRGRRPRCWLPSVVVEVPAGVPSPASVSPWKMRAVRFCLRFKDRAFTSKDLEAAGLSRSTFDSMGLLCYQRTEGRLHVYTLTDSDKRPDLRYPEIVDALTAAGGPANGPQQQALL